MPIPLQCPYWKVCVTPNWYPQADYIKDVCATEKYEHCLHFGSLQNHFTVYLPSFMSDEGCEAEFKRTARYLKLQKEVLKNPVAITIDPIAVQEEVAVTLNDPPRRGWERVGRLVFQFLPPSTIRIANKSDQECREIYARASGIGITISTCRKRSITSASKYSPWSGRWRKRF